MELETQYVLACPLLIDLGDGEGAQLLEAGRAFTAEEVAPWGRSLTALIDNGKVVELPRLTDDALVAEVLERGLADAVAAAAKKAK